MIVAVERERIMEIATLLWGNSDEMFHEYITLCMHMYLAVVYTCTIHVLVLKIRHKLHVCSSFTQFLEADIQHSKLHAHCIASPYFSCYTCDDFCQNNIKNYHLSFGKGYQIIYDAKFLQALYHSRFKS